ncbi:MAG: multifunctional transcriptional regulator/nicotinamide-nucleotide adenylyltransferase/ribosylnicotinamide kinase NadR [Clostridia bacterium]|nr:multifunctional transcriptional regulator/nicotinamide-nucleotide adenylyltransferase/ribosylnicotinamide kinase NadR [Clostridia bacterium]
MYKTGIFPGKFTPPHRGHLNAIIHAATRCEQLYVVVSDNPALTQKLCSEAHLPMMDMNLRAKWLSQELQGFGHIKVLMLDEEDIPLSPYRWDLWAEKLKMLVPEQFDVIFGGEREYEEHHKIFFDGVAYEVYDHQREKFSVSATKIRHNPLVYWDYVLESSRYFFAKKVLIAGTESCGKTTITKYLAKIFNTSYSEEVGRYYSSKYLGGNEQTFILKDFEMIAYQQYQADMEALQRANKVAFFDSDAVTTQYYAHLYLNQHSDLVEKFIDPSRYDLVLFFAPDVKWVDDGLRWNKDDETRKNLHEKLKQMYIDYGFGNKMIEIKGNYNERLQQSMKAVDNILK